MLREIREKSIDRQERGQEQEQTQAQAQAQDLRRMGVELKK